MQVTIQPEGVDLSGYACFGARVASSVDTDEEREKAALRRAKTQLEKDLVRATWEIYRLAKAARPHGLTIEKLSEKAHGNFRSFNNWKQAHEVPKLPNLQKFAAVVGANVRVVVQDAASEEVLSGDHDMTDDAIELANEIDKLPDEDRAAVRAFIAGMRAKSRPSERAEESAGTSRGPRR